MKTKFLSVILIIILGFSVYANSINDKFIWDDDALIKDNIYIKKWANIQKVFTKDIGAGYGKEYHAYRPIQMLTYMLDYSFWKLNSRGYHFTNIFLHILVALLIYWFVNTLFKDQIISFFASVLFVVHPIHTEAVTYISGRADPLAAIFILLSFIFYIKYLRSKSKSLYIIILIGYALAILSKEYSLILPALLIIYHYAFKVKFRFQQFLPILAVGFLYILLRLTILSSLMPSHEVISSTLLQRIPGFFVAPANYIRLLLLPLNLHMEYGNGLFNMSDPRAIFGCIILVLLSVIAFVKRKKKSLIFFSISWFFLSLLPQSNLYPINAYMAEHWLYLPSIGFFLILANGIDILYNRNKNLKIIALMFWVFLLSFYSFLAIRQNNYWKEPIAFYKRNLKYAPNSVRLLNNLAWAYHDMGKYAEAIELYKKSIEINPLYQDAYNNLAIVYHDMGKYAEAIELYRRVIKSNPAYLRAYNNLGNSYKESGNIRESIAVYKKAIQLNPDFADAYYNLGLAYKDIGENKEAISLFEKTLKINPDYIEAYNNLAGMYLILGKKEEAIYLLKKALKIDPDFQEARANLRRLENKK